MAMSLQRQVSLSLQRQVSTSGNLNDALEEDDARNEDRRRDDRRREAARARFRRGVRKAVLMSRFIQNTKTAVLNRIKEEEEAAGGTDDDEEEEVEEIDEDLLQDLEDVPLTFKQRRQAVSAFLLDQVVPGKHNPSPSPLPVNMLPSS